MFIAKMVAFIPFIIHCIIFAIYLYTSRNKICLSNFILGLHTLSMFSYGVLAIFFCSNYYYNIEAYLLMLFSLIILLWPLRLFENKISKNSTLSLIPKYKYKIITSVLIALGSYALYFFAKNIFYVFMYGIASVRSEGLVFYESSVFSKLAILGAFSSTYSIILFYYTIIHYGITLRAKLLIITSLSFVLYTLNVAGRDGIVIWFFSFIGSYCLFYPYLKETFRKNIKKTLKYLALIFIPLFLTITFARFASSGNFKDGLESLFSYIGQPLNNLSYSIDFTNKTHMRSGNGSYPFQFVEYIFSDGKNTDENRMDKIRDLIDQGFRANQFSSYIGHFYPAYPFYVFVIFLAVCFWVYSQLKINENIVTVSSLLLVFPWYMILCIGVFYFYYSEIAGNVYLILPFIFLLFIKFKLRIHDISLPSNL